MFTNVVWATDGSEHADRALDYAEQLITRDGGTLHVMHIVEKLLGPRIAGQDAKLDAAEIEAKVRAQAQQAEREGFQVRLHMTSGNTGEIARRIAEEAADARAEVIVVGTRGHSGVVSVVVGSVTQRLLRVAHCPVLAVPPPRDVREHREPGAETTDTVAG